MTSNAFARYDLFNKGGRTVRDNDEKFPSDGYVLDHWLTTKQAADKLKVKSVQAVQGLIRREKLRAKKIGSERRGEWRIDPQSLEDYMNTKM